MESDTHTILASGVELTSGVITRDKEISLVDKTSDHPVVGGLEELCTQDCALGHDTGTVALLGAPRNLLTLSVSDDIEFGRAPQAEVCVSMNISASPPRPAENGE